VSDPGSRIPRPRAASSRSFKRRRRRRRHRLVLRPVGGLDGRANLRHAGSRIVHLHRVTRDIQADASGHPVRVPFRFAVRLAALDEAIVVVAVPRTLASTETWHVVQHLRMAGRKRVNRLYQLGRTRRSIRTGRKRRQFTPVRGRRWCEPDNGGRGRCRRLRGARGNALRHRCTAGTRCFVVAAGCTERAEHDCDHSARSSYLEPHLRILSPGVDT
jgi:hypothetical protein